jgi:dephospho-CoA kinase
VDTTPPASSDSTLRIGLTGGIASGKSTVAELFADLGVPVIDTDVIARDVVAAGEPVLENIRHEFGDDVFDEAGELDRGAMRRIVFSDNDARHRLEAILHPRIQAAAIEQASSAGGRYQLIVVPLLTESPIREFIDRVLVVDCEESAQIRRLMARDAESEGQARRILSAQASRDERLKIADDVIHNDGDLAATLEQVQTLHQQYLALTTL